jgi:regulatory protein
MSSNYVFISFEEAQTRAAKFCVYQERHQEEVRRKLLTLQIKPSDIERIISFLIEHNYLNEQRFASAYARGKMRIKHWGKLKIKAKLKFLGLTDNCIKSALLEINYNEYYNVLSYELQHAIKKSKQDRSSMKILDARHKLISKGFENNLIDEILKQYKDDYR